MVLYQQLCFDPLIMSYVVLKPVLASEELMQHQNLSQTLIWWTLAQLDLHMLQPEISYICKYTQKQNQ